MAELEAALAEFLGLNEEQRLAAADCDHDVLVSAGAGTGKTRVLTARYLFLVAVHGYRPGQIAAITFTNKAAAEMRHRIRSALITLAGRFPALAGAVDELALAPIQTIHGFCLRLLREEPVISGFPPGFGILEEGEAGLLLHEACEEALADALEKNPEPTGLRELLQSFPRRRLLGLLRDVHEELRVHGLGPSAARLADETGEDAAGEELLGWWRRMAVLDEGGLPEATRKALGELRALGEDLAEAAARGDGDDPVFAELRRALGGIRAGSCRKLVEEGKEKIARFFTALALRRVARIGPIFLELLRTAGTFYEEAKRRRLAVDFADLELQAGKLLASEEVRRRFRARYPVILIDEFQDTNPLQWSIIKAFRGGPDGSRLFAVGDVKQSIYRFRGARVEIMLSLRRELEAGGGRVYALRENYRCLPALAAFVNHTAGGLLGEEMVYEPLIPKRKDTEGRPRVEVFLASEDRLDREAEAAFIAARINEILSGREEIVAGEDGPRPVEPGEIALLFRAASNIGIYERALRAAGLRYRVLAGEGFFDRPEVADLLALLSVVEDPGNGNALAAALRSPLFGMGDAGLYLIAREAGLTAGFFSGRTPEGLGDDLPRLERARAVIGRLRERRHLLGLDGLLAEAMTATDCLAVQAVFPDYRQRLANLEALMDMARRYTFLGRGEIGQFLSYLKTMEHLEMRIGGASSISGREAVSLITVHRAKGLEFPVVFLPDLGRSVDDLHQPGILVGEDARLGFKFGPKAEGKATPAWCEIDDEMGRAGEAEAKRLLYVAMTRARDCLILVGSGRRTGRSWLAWLAGTVPFTEAGDGAFYPGGEVILRPAPSAPPSISAPRTLIHRYPGIRRGESLGLPAKTREPSPPRDLQPSSPVTLGVSGVLAYDSCPRRFFLEYFLGLPERFGTEAGTKSEGGGALLGSLVHSLAAEMAASGERVLSLPAEIREDLEPEAVERLLDNYIRTESFTALLDARRVLTEYQFALALPSGVLLGAADLVWLDGEGRPCLADLKTNRIDRPGGPLLHEHSLQVRLYALALRRLFGGPVARARIEYLWPGIGVEVACEAERLDEIEKELDGFMRFLAGSPGIAEFPVRPGEACRWCGYHGTSCVPAEAG